MLQLLHDRHVLAVLGEQLLSLLNELRANRNTLYGEFRDACAVSVRRQEFVPEEQQDPAELLMIMMPIVGDGIACAGMPLPGFVRAAAAMHAEWARVQAEASIAEEFRLVIVLETLCDFLLRFKSVTRCLAVELVCGFQLIVSEKRACHCRVTDTGFVLRGHLTLHLSIPEPASETPVLLSELLPGYKHYESDTICPSPHCSVRHPAYYYHCPRAV